RLMVAARLCPTPAQLDAVDEITQEVMLALTTSISRLESQTVDGLRAYLSGIVMHKVAGALRQQQRDGAAGRSLRSLDSTVASLSQAGPLWQFLSASGTSLCTAVARAEMTERLIGSLGRLQAQYREIITLAFFDQLSVSEIARRQGTSRPAVSMLLIRAVQMLRQAMTAPRETGTEHGTVA
ncbi:MAG: sigma-70 family RNA polymerase sigma factor, partial [Planctomycetes bacterium]|nr:sigma-70 family RNA polymerase sigma factor [Planctomycetota bacterium]